MRKMTIRLRGAPPPKPPIHEQEQKPPVTPIPPIAYPWYEPNQQPGYWWQLPVHLPTTPLPQLPTHEHKQEPNTSIPVPIWKMRSSVHVEPGPNPRTYEPAPNPPITYIQWWTPPSVNLPSVWPNVTLPMQTWRSLYNELFPKPTTHEGEPNQPAFTLRDLQQLLDHLPKTPLPRLPEAEPREAPFPKQQKPKQTGGIGWIYEQRPAFTPVVFYDSAKGTIYTPPIAFQPIIPKSPPTHHVVVETNPLTF